MVAFILLGIFSHAESSTPPPPAIPVGNLVVSPTNSQTGSYVSVTWSVFLPENVDGSDYITYIRQVQIPDMIIYDTPVDLTGESISSLEIGPSGSRFELWTVRISPESLTAYLLSTTTVGPSMPVAEVTIHSEDPYSILPRTRADRPFLVDVIVENIHDGVGDPAHMKGVTLTRHAQPYSPTGIGDNLDLTQATLISQSPITSNGTQRQTFVMNSIPGLDRAKVRGEERFAVFSLPDEFVAESNLASKFIQIWPVADGAISGIDEGQIVGGLEPEITFTLHDLYPSSTTWAQVYKGSPVLGTTGTIVPGSSVVINGSVPVSRVLKASNYASMFDSDGLWTMELLTQTPFGIDRLACVSFTVENLGVTRETWRQTHFGSGDNSGDGADLNDYDKDGLPNLIEYAFGLDPKQNSAGQLPAPQDTGDQRVISFTRPAGVTGITYGAEWSSSLLPGSWESIPNASAAPQHSFSVSLDKKPILFMRLKVMGE